MIFHFHTLLFLEKKIQEKKKKIPNLTDVTSDDKLSQNKLMFPTLAKFVKKKDCVLFPPKIAIIKRIINVTVIIESIISN